MVVGRRTDVLDTFYVPILELGRCFGFMYISAYTFPLIC